MKVVFQSDWFGPGGRSYRKADNPHEVDEELRKQLPSTAKVLEDDPPPEAPKPAPVKIKI